jgi:hypothetical protein
MRILTTCALGALALCAAPGALAQRDDGARWPALFISPMGEAFRANASGARGVDLWFTEADTNYDMRISHDEFIANANAFLTHADANQDGALTSVEDTAYWQRAAPEVVNGPAGGEPIANTIAPPEQHQRNDSYTVSNSFDVNIRGARRGRSQERPEGAQAYGLLGDIEPVMSCDSNFDRRVTQTEFDACADRRFAMLDLNHDGYVTADEINEVRNTNAGGDIVRVRGDR